MSEFKEIRSLLKNYDYRGYINAVNQLKNINYQDLEGNTLLHFCVNYCNNQALLYTMGKKANLDLGNIPFFIFI